MMNVQATNYNPAFKANVNIKPVAQQFLDTTKRMPKQEIEAQLNTLKTIGGKDTDNITVTVNKLFKDFRNVLVVSIEKVVGDKVLKGESTKVFYDYNTELNPANSKFDLGKMAMSAIANAK